MNNPFKNGNTQFHDFEIMKDSGNQISVIDYQMITDDYSMDTRFLMLSNHCYNNTMDIGVFYGLFHTCKSDSWDRFETFYKYHFKYWL